VSIEAHNKKEKIKTSRQLLKVKRANLVIDPLTY